MITTTNKILAALLGLAIIVIVVLFLMLRKTSSNLQDAIAQYQYSIQTMDSLRNKSNQIISEQQVALAATDKQMKEMSKTIFDLKTKDERQVKQIDALIRIAQSVGVDSIYVPYIVHDTVDAHGDSLVRRDQVVVPPQSFNDSTANHNISGRVLLHGVALDHVLFTDSLSMRIVEKKQGWFKPPITYVQAVNDNPEFGIKGIHSMMVKPKHSTINKILPFVGLAAGVFLGHKYIK